MMICIKTKLFKIIQYRICKFIILGASFIVFTASLAVATEVGEYRDPTTPMYQPNSVVEQSPLQLTLTSIANVDHIRFAIINGQRLYEGDMIMGAKIIKISKQSVQYAYGGKNHWLSVEVIFNQDEASYENQ